jgi:hypothetical protein
MKQTYTLASGVVTASATRQKETMAMLGMMHYAYTIEIAKDGVKKTFTFHDSSYNYERGIQATNEMINDAVDCILSDAYAYSNNGDVYDFAEEFGYDPYEEYEKAEKIYNACGKTYDKLRDLLSLEDMEELSEIVRSQQ